MDMELIGIIGIIGLCVIIGLILGIVMGNYRETIQCETLSTQGEFVIKNHFLFKKCYLMIDDETIIDANNYIGILHLDAEVSQRRFKN